MLRFSRWSSGSADVLAEKFVVVPGQYADGVVDWCKNSIKDAG